MVLAQGLSPPLQSLLIQRLSPLIAPTGTESTQPIYRTYLVEGNHAAHDVTADDLRLSAENLTPARKIKLLR